MHTLWRRLYFLCAILLGLGTFLAGAGAAFAQADHPQLPAHASVLKAIPAIGSTISQAPTKVTVFTAENINPDPRKSNLFVYGPGGEATARLISMGNATVSLTNPEEMSVSLKPDPQHINGIYIVNWITVSALDGDPDAGAFTFTVNTGAAATPVATSTTGQATTPNGSTTTGTGGTPIWVSILVALVALAVGLGGGLVFGRRRPASSLGAVRKTVRDAQQESVKRP